MINKKLKDSFSLATSYIGIIIGPAMVSGTFAVNYYAKYGLNAFWLPILTVLLAGLIIYKGLEFARKNDCYDYDSFSKKIYGKWYKYINPIFTLLMIVIGFVSISVHYALGASLISSIFNCNYFLGCCIIGLMILALTIFGAVTVRSANKIMFFIMIGITLIFTGYSIFNKPINLFETQSLTSGIVMALAYGFANSAGTIMPVISMGDKIDSKEKSKFTAIFAMVFNYIVIILTVLMILPYCPGVLNSDTPVLSILNTFNNNYLGYIYTVLLFLAILSSAPSLLLAQTRRWSKILPDTINDKLKRFIIAFIFSTGACLIAKFGVSSIVNTIYTIVGFAAVPILYLPIILRKN